MYDCCNSCGANYCASAVRILRQIASLVCDAGETQTNNGNGSSSGCGCRNRCGCCMQTRCNQGFNQTRCGQGYDCGCGQTGGGYSFPVSGRMYVTANGWCNGGMNFVLTPCGQTATLYGGNGCTATTQYGTNCGCAFQTLNS